MRDPIGNGGLDSSVTAVYCFVSHAARETQRVLALLKAGVVDQSVTIMNRHNSARPDVVGQDGKPLTWQDRQALAGSAPVDRSQANYVELYAGRESEPLGRSAIERQSKALRLLPIRIATVHHTVNPADVPDDLTDRPDPDGHLNGRMVCRTDLEFCHGCIRAIKLLTRLCRTAPQHATVTSDLYPALSRIVDHHVGDLFCGLRLRLDTDPTVTNTLTVVSQAIPMVQYRIVLATEQSTDVTA